MSRELLGELEHRVLLALLSLDEDAYSVSVALHLEERTRHGVQLATIQVSLKRLEQKGLASSRVRTAPADEGGRQRRYFALTADGRARLEDARADLLALWRDTPLAGEAP